MVETETEPLISTIKISTPGRGFRDISGELQEIMRQSGVKTGICHVFLRHTSASLLITENADPDVLRDLENFISALAPDGNPAYFHSMEGPDDMPAHVKASLFGSSVTIPICDGRLSLGTWQGIFLCEHRDRGGGRRLVLTINGQRK